MAKPTWRIQPDMPRWRAIRITEMSRDAWNWCLNNGKAEFCDKRGEITVGQETIDLIQDNWNLAGHIFCSRMKEKRKVKT